MSNPIFCSLKSVRLSIVWTNLDGKPRSRKEGPGSRKILVFKALDFLNLNLGWIIRNGHKILVQSSNLSPCDVRKAWGKCLLSNVVVILIFLGMTVGIVGYGCSPKASLQKSTYNYIIKWDTTDNISGMSWERPLTSLVTDGSSHVLAEDSNPDLYPLSGRWTENVVLLMWLAIRPILLI